MAKPNRSEASLAQRREYQRRYRRSKRTGPARKYVRHGLTLNGDRRGYNREYMFYYNLSRLYGITFQQYANQMCKQDFACAICEVPFTKRPHVDHCHRTGQFRGLLCNTCNSGLGKLKDSVKVLRKAIRYLEENGATE